MNNQRGRREDRAGDEFRDRRPGYTRIEAGKEKRRRERQLIVYESDDRRRRPGQEEEAQRPPTPSAEEDFVEPRRSRGRAGKGSDQQEFSSSRLLVVEVSIHSQHLPLAVMRSCDQILVVRVAMVLSFVAPIVRTGVAATTRI